MEDKILKLIGEGTHRMSIILNLYKVKNAVHIVVNEYHMYSLKKHQMHPLCLLFFYVEEVHGTFLDHFCLITNK
jgi:hypothetical protein